MPKTHMRNFVLRWFNDNYGHQYLVINNDYIALRSGDYASGYVRFYFSDPELFIKIKKNMDKYPTVAIDAAIAERE